MKKKRLLAIFAAFAVAATMVFGFSACEDRGDTASDDTQKEQPDDGDKENPDQSGSDNENPNQPDDGDNNNPEQPDDSKDDVGGKMTEEQWRQALADTLAATSYSVEEYAYTGSDSDVATLSGVELYEYDAVNGSAFRYYSQVTQEVSASYYYKLSGSDVICYDYFGYSISKDTRNFDSQAEAEEYFADLSLSNGVVMLLLIMPFKSENGEEKQLSELYSEITYDAATDSYSFPCFIEDAVYESATMTFEFQNGRISSIKVLVTFITGETVETSHIVLNISGYNSTTVEIPEYVNNDGSSRGETRYVGIYLLQSITCKNETYYVGESLTVNDETILLTPKSVIITLDCDETSWINPGKITVRKGENIVETDFTWRGGNSDNGIAMNMYFNDYTALTYESIWNGMSIVIDGTEYQFEFNKIV